MDDFKNEEVATFVSYAMTFDNCEEAMRQFKSKLGKEGPQVRTLRMWRQRYDSWHGAVMILIENGADFVSRIMAVTSKSQNFLRSDWRQVAI